MVLDSGSISAQVLGSTADQAEVLSLSRENRNEWLTERRHCLHKLG